MATVIGGASESVTYRITYRKIPQIPKSITSFSSVWAPEKAKKNKEKENLKALTLRRVVVAK